MPFSLFFQSFFLCFPLTRYFQITSLWLHIFFLLLDQVWYWCFLLHFSPYSLYSLASEFVSFLWFLSIKLSFHLCIFLLISFTYISLFPVVHWVSLIQFFFFFFFIIDLDFFGAGYWKHFVFLGWCHVP